MNKAILYKALKSIFFLAGFPLLIILMIITMAPMFGTEVLGNHAQNWIIAFTVIWVVLLIIHFLLEKFIGEKSEAHHKVVLVVMSALSILCILLPSAIFDAVTRPKYEAAQKQLVGEVDIKNYDAVAGWHRDFTKRYDSDVYVLINENYDFIKQYGMEHTYSEWYDNADKEHNLGYKYGSFEKAKVLTEQKLEALRNLEAAKAELAEIEAEIDVKLQSSKAADEALAQNPNDEALVKAAEEARKAYDDILAEKEEDLVRLKGSRVDITEYKGEIVDILLAAIKDKDLLPDGLTLNLLGIDIPVGDLLDLVMQYAGGFLNAETINGLIPDVIYTGMGPQTVSTYQKAVDGSDSDLSLADAQKLNFKYTYYPSVLAGGAMKYVCYVCVGIVVLSLFLTDYFAKKQKEEEKKND